MENFPQPPRWPLRVLRFFIKKNYLEEIEGDMEEVFRDNLERMSVKRARRQYGWDIINLLRPILIRNLFGVRVAGQAAIISNYFKVSLRGLMKSPLNSFINVFGLAAAIGICVFGYAFARWTYSTDQFHELKNEVYLVTFFAQRDGTPQQYGTTPRPLGEILRQDFSAVKRVCRIEDRSVVVKHSGNVFHQRIRFTDPEFLQMLTFPLKWGSAATLADVNTIILSEPMSEKYFGESNPVGLMVQVYFDKGNYKEFKVGGVAGKFPDARTIAFDFLVNINNLRTAYPTYDFHDWGALLNATLVQVPVASDVPSVVRTLETYRTTQNMAVKDEWAIISFALEPIATLHERTGNIRDDISRSSDGNYATIVYLVFVSLLLMLVACFNYINIAIVTAARRLKEIGVRKTIGARRGLVITQFLTENIVTTFFALIVGMGLALFVFIPGFESLWSFNMNLRFTDPVLWLYLAGVLLFTSLASGFYPALYISRFQVVNILKGSIRFGQRNPLTKVFMTVQLVICCVFITSAIMFTQNTNYLTHRPWGYNQAGTMYAVLPDALSHEQLSTAMAQLPEVHLWSGSRNHLGKSHQTTVLQFPNRELEVDQLSVDARYLETMGLQLREGRFFEDHDGSDRTAVVVNELLASTMNWSQPVGQTFRIDSTSYEVIGVVRDFHNYSFTRTVRPIIFTVATKEEYKYLALQVNEASIIPIYKKLQDTWAVLFPEVPFEGGLQQDVWGFYFEEISIHRLVWRILATIAVTLAVLGLYGLVSLNVEGRVREFSIRKALGAGLTNIANNISRQYFLLFSISLAVGGPLGYFASTTIVHSAYTYHVPFSWWGTIVAMILLSLVMFFAVATQVARVARKNPVEGLKVE